MWHSTQGAGSHQASTAASLIAGRALKFADVRLETDLRSAERTRCCKHGVIETHNVVVQSCKSWTVACPTLTQAND